MKKILFLISILLLMLTVSCGAPVPSEADASVSLAAGKPEPTTAQDAVEAATADELQELIVQFNSEKNYKMAYVAAIRLTELDISDTEAYKAAMDALLAMSKSNCEEINRLLKQGSEKAQDKQALVWWVKDHQSDLKISLPFMPDYDSPDEINTEGITPGNLSKAMKDGGGWKAGLLTSQGGWTYLSRPDKEYAIYKMRADDSEYQRIGEDTGSSLNVIGDWLYYISLSDGSKIYKMRTDGRMKAKLSDDATEFLSVSGGWMYYNNLNDGGCLYKVKTDGSGKAKLTEKPVMVPCVSGDWVYFRYSDKAGDLWRISVNGGKEQQIVSARMMGYCIMNDWVYYVEKDMPYCVRRVKTDGTGYEEIYPCPETLISINGAGSILYLPYNSISESDGLIIGKNVLVLDMVKLNRLQNKEMEIGPVYAGSGGYMYFLKYSEGFAWYAMDANGNINKLG